MLKKPNIRRAGLFIMLILCISSLLVSCGGPDVKNQLAKDIKYEAEKLAVSSKEKEYYSVGYRRVLIDDNSQITVGEVIQIGEFYENIKDLPMNANTVDKALQNKVALKHLREYDYFLRELQNAHFYPNKTFGDTFFYIDTLVRDENDYFDKSISKDGRKYIEERKDELFRLNVRVEDNLKANSGNTIVREVKIENNGVLSLQWISFSSKYGRVENKVAKEADYISSDNLYEDPDLKNKVKGDILINPGRSKTYWYPSTDGRRLTYIRMIGSVRFLGMKATINSLDYYYSKGLLQKHDNEVGTISRPESKNSHNWWCSACGIVSRTASYGPCHGSRDGRHYWNATSMEP